MLLCHGSSVSLKGCLSRAWLWMEPSVPRGCPRAAGVPGVEVSKSLCCAGSCSQCLLVSLQFPWMAEAGLGLFPAGLFSCSFQQMLLREHWSLFLLAAGLVLLKLGSFPGFGTAGESSSLDLLWRCSGLLPSCCSELCSVLGPRQSSSKPQELRPLGILASEALRTPGQTSQALGAGGILCPRGNPGCVRALQGCCSSRSSARGCSCSLGAARLLQVPPLCLSPRRGSGVAVHWSQKVNYRYAVGTLVMQ